LNVPNPEMIVSVLCVFTVKRRYEFLLSPFFIYFIATGRLPTFLFDSRNGRTFMSLFVCSRNDVAGFLLVMFNRLHR
jgi:hypothetical protein